MIPIRASSSIFLLALLAASASVARAQGLEYATQVVDRCERYGPGFVDLGGGTCGRVVISGRVHVGGETQPASGWAANGTSNAGLRSDGLGMLPGAADARHLRVQSGVDPYSR